MNDEDLKKAASEMGKRGSKSLINKYGREHMARLGRISGSIRGLRKVQRDRKTKQTKRS